MNEPTRVHEGLKDGQYLCEVTGLEYSRYMVLAHDEFGWWRYLKDETGGFDCWIMADDVKVVRVVTLLEEDKE